MWCEAVFCTLCLKNWFKLVLAHKCCELWEKTDLKEKQGQYGLAARSEKTGLYFT